MNARLENAIDLSKLVGSSMDIHALQSYARSLHRLDEASCNGYQTWRGEWDEEAEQRAERREASIEEKAARIALAWGLKVYRQSDPRGWPLYLYRESDLASSVRFAGCTIDSCYDSVGIAVCPR